MFLKTPEDFPINLNWSTQAREYKEMGLYHIENRQASCNDKKQQVYHVMRWMVSFVTWKADEEHMVLPWHMMPNDTYQLK